ncbi:MAG: hypothetical protein ACR2KX_05080, partial [Chitinophagaceae bacterium]
HYCYHPCGLLMFRSVTSAHKRLSLSGFPFLRTIFIIQGTHKRFAARLADGITIGYCTTIS